MCGKRLSAECAECGFSNPLTYRFCGMCGKTINLEIAGAMIESQLPQAMPIVPAPIQPAHILEGERRVVTVIVTDLNESTQLLEKLGTENWVEKMNVILHILESEIHRFGGEISQFRGDGLVALFGATLAHEDDAERAVLAALSMQRAFTSYVRDMAIPQAINLKMRVGVNTGEVIVASVSDRQHWEETAMGMAIAVAARMETAAEPGTVLVSEHTHKLIEAYFDWQILGEIFVKGVSQPIAVYRPVAHSTDPEYTPQPQEFSNSIPLIGRDKEIHVLKDCVQGLFDGRGHIATVQGDKGSGKSFLLRNVRQYFAHRGALLAESQSLSISDVPVLTWVTGRCRSYSQAWPYSLWFDLFRDWLKFKPDDSKQNKSAHLRHRTEELWGDKHVEHYPYIATFLGLPLEETYSEKIRHLDGEGLRQRFFLAVRSWIESTSRIGPLVLALADLQWADDSSLTLLKYCLSVCDNEALLWVPTFRPERENPMWEIYHYIEIEYPHRLININLLPLTEAQSQELLNHVIGSQALTPETSKLIIHNAGGNPYYILELVRVLIANGVLACDEDGSRWHITRAVTSLDLPDSLQQLLIARLDRLTPAEHLLFQVAAVIGPVFWFNMLQAMIDDTNTLKSDLSALQRSQFIEENGRVPELGMQYTIRSPLLRDTAYDSLLNNQRAAYHIKAAEYLESLSAPDVPGGYDGMLAYHYRGAGNPKKELFYTHLAADKARKIYANTEALQFYTRAIELLDLLEKETISEQENRIFITERFEVLNDRREVLQQLGQFEASRNDTLALLPLAKKLDDDKIWTVDALLAQAEISAHSIDDLRQGLQTAWDAFSLSQQLGDQYREMRSLIRISNYLLLLKDPAWHEMVERALQMTRQVGDLKAEVNLLLRIGSAYGIDDLPRSREYLQAALSKSESLNDKATELSLLDAIGQQFERDGNYYKQLVEYEEKKLRISREIGHRLREANALNSCGQIQALYLGDYEGGLELCKQSLHILENLPTRLFPILRIAQIESARGNYAEALATLESAYPLGEKIISDTGRVGIKLVTAIVYNLLGDEGHLWSAIHLTSEIQQMVANNMVSRQYQMTAASEASVAHLKLARLYSVRGNSESQEHIQQALESSQTCLNIYGQFGFVQVVECTSEEIFYRHSQVLAANGQAEEAADFVKRASDEMMRKYELIPTKNHFRKTFLRNITLHVDIRSAIGWKKHS